MPVFKIELTLDGYDSPEEEEKACRELIQSALDFSASSVKIIEDTVAGEILSDIGCLRRYDPCDNFYGADMAQACYGEYLHIDDITRIIEKYDKP